MKGFVTVILFFLFALAIAGTEYVDAVPAASMTVCTVQHTDTTPQHSKMCIRDSLCTSVNDQVVHGIPNDIPLKEGDIVSVDCGTYMNGFCGCLLYTSRCV